MLGRLVLAYMATVAATMISADAKPDGLVDTFATDD